MPRSTTTRVRKSTNKTKVKLSSTDRFKTRVSKATPPEHSPEPAPVEPGGWLVRWTTTEGDSAYYHGRDGGDPRPEKLMPFRDKDDALTWARERPLVVGKYSVVPASPAAPTPGEGRTDRLRTIYKTACERDVERARASKAEAELARYSMGAGEADQYKNEAEMARRCLFPELPGDEVTPSDIEEAVKALRAERNALAKALAELARVAGCVHLFLVNMPDALPMRADEREGVRNVAAALNAAITAAPPATTAEPPSDAGGHSGSNQ